MVAKCCAPAKLCYLCLEQDNDGYKSLKPKGIKQETLLSQIAAVWKHINQQCKTLIAANLTIQNLVQDIRNKASND
jgi:hypothetical protein